MGTLSSSETKTFGDLVVGLYNEDILPDYTIRTMKVIIFHQILQTWKKKFIGCYLSRFKVIVSGFAFCVFISRLLISTKKDDQIQPFRNKKNPVEQYLFSENSSRCDDWKAIFKKDKI